VEREEYIQTETGKRMLRAVNPIYTDEYQLSIFNANGLVMEEVHQAANKIATETLINNATWSLPYWESLFQIKPRDNQTIGQRRRAVILRMNEYFPVTRQRMESIIDGFTENDGTSIDDERGDYIFDVTLKKSGAIDLVAMIDAIEESKPAHLDYELYQENDSSMSFGTALLSGDETTIYPWSPTELTSRVEVNLGSYTQSIETYTVYPE